MTTTRTATGVALHSSSLIPSGGNGFDMLARCLSLNRRCYNLTLPICAVTVALGPLTNIAAGLRGLPNLMRNVARLVAVMGRRPGHLFHPAEGRGNGILFGHGPVFRDFNFDKDRAAASEIVAMNLPITLIPYEGARSVRLAAADLAKLETAGGAAAWVAQRARGWLKFWANVVGLDGFYPFDALAAAYAIEPKLFGCADAAVWVAKDGRRWGGWFGPEGLLVGLKSERVEKPMASGSLRYQTQAARV